FLSLFLRTPRSTLFPYTTLFRSCRWPRSCSRPQRRASRCCAASTRPTPGAVGSPEPRTLSAHAVHDHEPVAVELDAQLAAESLADRLRDLLGRGGSALQREQGPGHHSPIALGVVGDHLPHPVALLHRCHLEH